MPRVKSEGIGKVLILICCLLFSGCATTTQPDSKEALWRLYQRQQYAECLEKIEKMQNPRLPRRVQAELLLLQAICQEEMNHPAEASQLYRNILQDFPHTEA